MLPMWRPSIYMSSDKLMDANLARKWRRGALALAIPATCLFLVALICVGAATSRALWHHRAPGVVTDLTDAAKVGSRPMIEYSVGEKTYQIQTKSHYPDNAYAIGQNVTVLYSPNHPQRGMLGSFREQWQFPLFLSIVSLTLLGLAWKARTGLPPILHSLCTLWVLVLGAILGATPFLLLCARGGLEILAGAPVLVNFLGGALIFFSSVPLGAYISLTLWQRNVPARCPSCAGGMRLEFVGKQLIYTCTSCRYQPWFAASVWMRGNTTTK